MIDITDERYLPYIKATAYDVLRDGEFHALVGEVDAKIGTIADHLCQFRCEEDNRVYRSVRLLQEHGRRLLIQDAIDELRPRLESEIIDGTTQYRLASLVPAK